MSKPLTQPMFYLLLSLKQARHGYEVMQYVEDLTRGRVKIGPGTLYALLARFEEEGYIDLVDDQDQRKTYQITPLGQGLLEEEIRRLELLLKDAKGGRDYDL